MRTAFRYFVLSLLLLFERASAFDYVADANGTWWGIQDAAPPRVDTGSIRATQTGPGVSAPYSTSINGFGGIRVVVETTPAPRFNGELLRGFGLTFDGVSRFTTTTPIKLGGVKISRSVYINQNENWGRWLDTFTNTTRSPITIEVAFGGQSGIGVMGANSSSIVNTSDGDAIVTAADAWVEVATRLADATLVGGPQVTVLGTPTILARPFIGAMSFAGDWLVDPFYRPLTYAGHEANFQAYVNTITINPGHSRSLLHFVVLGPMVNAASSPSVRAMVEAAANNLAAAPPIGDLSAAEICSIDNFDIAARMANGFDYYSNCIGRNFAVQQPPLLPQQPATTTVTYDVVGKTIAQLRADLQSGITTSVQITQAYLDRIKAYDQGQLGFNAFEVIAQDALEQAKAADAARFSGQAGPLLGIPIAVKNLYDTFDMPATNGSLTFAEFRPAHDAFQVAQLRRAGAVIIGKTALEEYATSGNYSNDAWGQVWNVFSPSKSAIASSGGFASALAASLAAAALGSQTGDSLYGPSSAASLVTLRGTDGLESGTGVMPLTYLTDFGGVIARSVPDLADMLNVVVAVDPADPETSAPGRHTPADWRALLDPNALVGKRIGFIPSTWVDPFGTTNTTDAEKAALEFFEDAGAIIVEMGVTVGGADTPPAPTAPPGDIRAEGWGHYIDSHPELATQGFKIFTVVDVDCSQKKVAYVRPIQAPARLRPRRG
ncbi:MAG: hypothetical protein JO307_12585 [Bryobacterales bacterium]|nr:hypothetical protein [Bryobacterales bacterium]MBV9399954.1 hypothetical protein [Bryobacterales bacterium]